MNLDQVTDNLQDYLQDDYDVIVIGGLLVEVCAEDRTKTIVCRNRR